MEPKRNLPVVTPRPPARPALRALLLLLAGLLAALAPARHPANVASAQAKVAPDGTLTAHIRFDLTAFVTGRTPKEADDREMNAFLDGTDDAMRTALAAAEARFRRELDFGGTVDRLAFPGVADVRAFLAGNPSPRLPVMLVAVVEGHLTPGARAVAFRYPNALGAVIQTVEFPYTEPVSEPVEPGRASALLPIPTPEEVARLAAIVNAPRPAAAPPKSAANPVPKPPAPPVTTKRVPLAAAPTVPAPKATPAATEAPRGEGVLTRALDALARLEATVPQPAPAPTVEKEAPAPAQPSPTLPPVLTAPTPSPQPSPSPLSPNPSSSILTYLRMGFTHILPEGLDHILFVLGLFLLGSNTKALLKQVTAFTVAHSLTLALATLNVVHLPGRVIEPLIAFSIAFVAVENLLAKEPNRWRTLVVFGFGLVHGMGFAEVFHEAGLSGRGLLTALVSFNFGVEAGQLAVIGLALLAVGWFRKDARYRRVVVQPASATIALVALFWTAQRIFS